MAFGGHLCANNDIHIASLHRFNEILRGFWRANRIARQHRKTGLWKPPQHLFSQTFDAGATSLHTVALATLSAISLGAGFMAAMMAPHAACQTVRHHP